MGNLQVLKSRIASIEKTAAITNAMYKIASSKLVAAQNAFKQYNIFKTAFDNVLSEALNVNSKNLYTETKKRSMRKLFIIISADRGLVGGYHQQLFKSFLAHIETFDKNDIFVVTIGRRAYGFAKKEKLNIVNEEIILNHDDIDESILNKYMGSMMQLYLENQYGEISVFSNRFINSMSQVPKNEVLLPMKTTKVNKKAYDTYMYEGSKTDTINDLIMIYVQSRLYGLLVDAKLSEYASRIMAMKNATDNAKDALDRLNLKYHQARQQKITGELLDISNAKL